MMIANRLLRGDRSQVIANIAKLANAGDLNGKVETNDPVLSPAQQETVLQSYLQMRHTLKFHLNTTIVRALMWAGVAIETTDVPIRGKANLAGLHGGAIVTSNHFSPVENMIVRKAVAGHRMYIVSQLTNLQMGGFLGYIMNYGSTLPISSTTEYMGKQFPALLGHVLAKGAYVLIYPEQEMWFNYRQPRPTKRGAYYYAKRFNVPIVSCFIEMQDKPKLAGPSFHQVAFTMHVLKPIFPNPNVSEREDSVRMMKQDYAQKCAAYEQAYGRPVDYHFKQADIAGWLGPNK